MLSNLSMKTRLWLLGMVSTLGIAILAMSSIWHASHSKETLLNFVDQKIAVNRLATRIYANGLQSGQALRNIVLNPANNKAYDNFAAANVAFKEDIDKLTPLLLGHPGGKEVTSKLKNHIDHWQPYQAQIIGLVKGGNEVDAKTMLVAKETPAWRAVRGDLLELIAHSKAEAAQDRVSLIDGLNHSIALASVLSVVSFLLVAAITVFVARGIIHQVGGEPAYAATRLQRIAQGDLTHRFVVRPGDNSSIISAVDSMQSQIRQLISGTISSADSVVQESNAICADARRLSQSAMEQSSSASAIAAAVQQLTVSVGVMSDSANDVGRLAAQSEKQAHDSLGAVSVATATIQKVADGMTEAAHTMEELSNKVVSINGIVQTIREIADQTNLLALNAAIEAARAGEQGRGFAVVADEVRKLAERTTTSTQEISQIVGGVRDTTDVALVSMSRAKALALEGTTHTELVRNAVMELDHASADVGRAIESIASALREQTSASSDIAQQVESIAMGAEQTHAAASESNRRSGVLVDLSQALKESVSQFKV